ncbi:hypothetical protein [Citrobacter braakii]|uniref:hypothetical protein n=1 Tax=Citrobacter braakii TaxID=57706 RepID=UPI003976E931
MRPQTSISVLIPGSALFLLAHASAATVSCVITDPVTEWRQSSQIQVLPAQAGQVMDALWVSSTFQVRNCSATTFPQLCTPFRNALGDETVKSEIFIDYGYNFGEGPSGGYITFGMDRGTPTFSVRFDGASNVYQALNIVRGPWANQLTTYLQPLAHGGNFLSNISTQITTPSSVQFTIPSGDIYSTKNHTITYTVSGGIGNTGRPYPEYPLGDTVINYTKTLNAVCTIDPIQLTITTSAEVDFGNVATGGTSSVQREFTVQITSGNSVPTGTITFTSSNTSANSRIRLGGGEISINNKTTNQEYFMGTAYPVTVRNMTFIANLNAAAATPGAVTENLTVNMVVN